VKVQNNLSDQGEASSVLFTPYGGYASLPVLFNNGFTIANHVAISTCDTSAKSVPLPGNSATLKVRVQFTSNSLNRTAPMVLPFVESYDYFFPANFGSWQIDNLSAPGGPGGGWAFSYSPCS
jgi:hypothetical protein